MQILSFPYNLLLIIGAIVLLVGGCAVALDTRAERREADWAAAHPPAGQFIEIDGRRLHVDVAGQPQGRAPDVVLIHGASGNLNDFTFDLVSRLAPDFRVISVDRPGLGWSDSWGEADSDPQFQARVIRRALAQIGVERPVVVGHSYGGAVAMGWALEAEAETGALVLLAAATHPWPGNLGFWYRLNETPLARMGRRAVAALATQQQADSVARAIFRPAPVPPGYSDHFGPGLSLRRGALEANTRQVNALFTHVERMHPGYANLSLPVEAIHGDADRIVGLELHARRIAAEVPGARLTVIEGGGHMPHHSHPELTVEVIRRAAARAGLN